CKLPVIASDVQGINNMLHNNVTGILVPPQQPELLANAIDLLLNDNNLALQLATNAYQKSAERFSSNTIFESYKRIFSK
ncbi:MAG: glycosyltransferase, partial [Ferruginibacter sp.]